MVEQPVILSRAVVGLRLLDQSWIEIVTEAVVNNKESLANAARLWILATLLMLAWPAVSRWWSRWWTRHRQPQSRVAGGSYGTAARLSAMLLACALPLAGCGHSSSINTNTGTTSNTSSSPVTLPSEVRATGLKQFQMRSGSPMWQNQDEARAANCVLDLQGDNTFSFTTVDTVGMPVRGYYQVVGSSVTFSGSTHTLEAAGGNNIAIRGRIALDERTMELDFVDSEGASAVVDDQGFSSVKTAAWDATMSVSLS